MAGIQTKSAMMTLPFSLSTAFRNLTLTSTKRAFSTTPAPQKTKTLPAKIPPYPYGPNLLYKQSNSGLYGGARIQFGNKISQGKNEGKTKRVWRPNVRRKKIWSDALQKELYIKMTRRVLRTIRKCGGLDNYLLSDKPGRIKELGVFGWQLRWQVMQTPKIQKWMRAERERLGLPRPPSFKDWLRLKGVNLAEEVKDGVNIEEQTKPFYNDKLH